MRFKPKMIIVLIKKNRQPVIKKIRIVEDRASFKIVEDKVN